MKIKNIISLFMACSFIGLSAQPAFSEDYMVLPPLIEDDSYQTQQDQPLPGLTAGPGNDFMQQTQDQPQAEYKTNSYQMNNTLNTNTVPAYSATALKGTVSTVPVGTAFQVINNTTVNTKRNKVGDIFTATLNHPISVDGDIIVPAGSEITAQITYIEEAGRVGRNAKMEAKFTRIKPPYGPVIPMVGKVLTQDNSGILKGGTLKTQLVQHVKREAISTAGGAIIGSGIGAVAGATGTGLAAGAATGGVVGLGWIFWRKGKEVIIEPGTKMVIVLEQPFTVGE